MRKLRKMQQKPLTTKDGQDLAEKCKFDAYFEVSAKTKRGVQELFEHIAQWYLQESESKSPKKKFSPLNL